MTRLFIDANMTGQLTCCILTIHATVKTNNKMLWINLPLSDSQGEQWRLQQKCKWSYHCAWSHV